MTSPDTAATRALSQARAQRDAGQFMQACTTYLQVLQHDPGHAAATLEVAELMFRKLNQVERSIKYYDTAAKLDPDNDLAIRGKAQALTAAGKPDQARHALQRFVSMPCVSARGYLARGVMLNEQDQPELAYQALKRALDAAEGKPDQREVELQTHLMMAEVLSELGQEKTAAKHYAEYLRAKPNEPRAVRGYAATLNALKYNEKALKWLEHYQKLRPHEAWPLLTRARLLGVEMKQPQPAVEMLQAYEAVAKDASSLAEATYVRGEIAEHAGSLDDARLAYERCVKIDGGSPRNYYALARVLRAQGRKGRALKMAQRAAELGDDQTTYAMALERLERSMVLLERSRPSIKTTMRVEED